MCNNYLLWLRAVPFFYVFKNLRHVNSSLRWDLFLSLLEMYLYNLGENIHTVFEGALIFCSTNVCLLLLDPMGADVYTLIEDNEIKRGCHWKWKPSMCLGSCSEKQQEHKAHTSAEYGYCKTAHLSWNYFWWLRSNRELL